MFKRLQIGGWRQFEHVDLRFHRRLTVLTGANASGKTTLLNILNRHFGWSLYFMGTPLALRGTGPATYTTGRRVFFGRSKEEPKEIIGKIEYKTGQEATIAVPEEGSTYQVTFQGQIEVPGLFVPSHRPPFAYAPVTSIPTRVEPAEQLYAMYRNELVARFGDSVSIRSPSFRLKEALISLVVFGYGSDRVDRNDAFVDLFEGFQRKLRTVLPKSLGFKSLRVRVPEVILQTRTGDFMLDAVSGGIAALIDVTWQMFLRSQVDESFVVLIDEPENHLHPELQRLVLPQLMRAFPRCQFIVATHNPFIVTSVRDSNVYVLEYGERHRVSSQLLADFDKSGSANDVLRSALGLDATVPLWVEKELQGIEKRFAAVEEVDDEVVRDVRREAEEAGISRLFTDALSRVVDRDR